MARRSPARYLAPLALVAVSIALYSVVNSNLSSDEEPVAPNQATESRQTASPDGDSEEEPTTRRKGPRFYIVKAGDTPSSIADATGIELTDILRLNPDLDPQTLSPGERLRLRR
jgi:LysM repeat protein